MATLYDELVNQTLARSGIPALRATVGRPRTPPLPEQEFQRSLGEVLAGAGGSGLSAAFSAIDLIPSMIRDVANLSGDVLRQGPTLGALAKYNPFDQLLSPLSPRNRSSFIPEGAGLKDPRFWAGLAGEIALDPLTYVTGGFGALTKTGRAAKATGALKAASKELTEQLGRKVGQREASVLARAGDLPQVHQDRLAKELGRPIAKNELLGRGLGVGLPLTPFQTQLGSDPLRQGIARGLDVTGEAIRFSPPGRAFARTFFPSAGDESLEIGQRLQGQVFAGEEDRFRAHRELAAQVTTEGRNSGIIQKNAEGNWEYVKLWRALEQTEKLPGTATPGMHQAVAKVRGQLKGYRDRLESLGARVPEEFESLTGSQYIPRPGQGFTGSANAFIRRKEALRNIQGETGQLIEIIRDADVDLAALAGDKERLTGVLAEKFGDVIPEQMLDDAGREIGDQREALAELIMNLTPAQRRVGLFGTDPTVNITEHLDAFGTKIEQTEAALEFVAKNARAAGVLADQTGRPAHTIGKTLVQDLNMRLGGDRRAGALDNLAQSLPDELKDQIMQSFDPAAVKFAKRKDPALNAAARAQAIDKARNAHLRKGIAELEISDDLNGALKRLAAAERNPQKTLTALRRFNNYFRVINTVPWLNFNFRNFEAAQAIHLLAGHYPNPLRAAQTGIQVMRFAHGATDVIPSAKRMPAVRAMAKARGVALDDRSATEMLIELAHADQVVDVAQPSIAQELAAETGVAAAGPGVGDVSEVFGAEPIRLRQTELLGDRPFAGPLELGRMYFGLPGSGATILPHRARIRGVNAESLAANVRRQLGREPGPAAESARVSTFGPVAAGGRLTREVELYNRLPAYIELQIAGEGREVARAKVAASQVDYSTRRFSKFEQDYMLPWVPFYKWFSRQIPHQLQQLTRQGVVNTRTAARFEERAREQTETYVPERYRRQAGIPLGGPTEQGYQQVIAGFDLPFHSALEAFQTGPTLAGTLQRTGQGLGGMIHPLARFAIEQGTGQSLFTGRNLADLEGGLNRSLTNLLGKGVAPRIPQPVENLALQAAAPLGRLNAIVSQATDPRVTPLNRLWQVPLRQLTGTRIATYDPERELQDAAEDVITERGLGDFLKRMEITYVDRDQELTVGEQQLADLLKEAQRRTREVAKRRKIEKLRKEWAEK